MPFQPGFRGKRPPDFPAVEATNTGSGSGTTVAHNLPAGIAAGNLLLLYVRATEGTISTPSGWTQLFQVAVPGGAIRGAGFYRIADGSEGATVSVTNSVSGSQGSASYRISGAFGAPEASSTTGTGTSVDPPNLAPSWGSAKTLWIATGIGHSIAISGTPTNYTNGIGTSTGYRTAQRELEASSEDPGAYGQGASFGWLGVTTAVRGIP